MAWWVGALIQAAPYIYSAIAGKNQGDNQSDITSTTALANSIAINAAGAANAKSVMAMAMLKANLGVAIAENQNVQVRALTDMNAERASFMGDYEASLLENEAALTVEAAGLDLKQLDRMHKQAIGDIKVNQAASGAIINQDTPADSINAAKEQQAMEEFIVRRGADIQYAKFMDAAALSRWEGNQEAQKITFEGRLLEQSNLTGAVVGGFGAIAQGTIDASAIKYNTTVAASQTMTTGLQKADAQSWAGSSAFWSGIFGAGTSIGSSYIKNKEKEDSYSLLEDK